jgi:uncharacterized protein YjiS (DUF1127 family)
MSMISPRIPTRGAVANFTPRTMEPCHAATATKQPWLRSLIREVWRRRQSRNQLATLDARMLRDIGLTSCDVDQEANKPFWRP